MTAAGRPDGGYIVQPWIYIPESKLPRLITHGQGYVSMSGLCKEFQRAVLVGEISHGGHPALRWQVVNAVIDEDLAENIKVTKMRSREKIVAVVAAVMVVGRAAADEVAPSPYLTREEGFVFV